MKTLKNAAKRLIPDSVQRKINRVVAENKKKRINSLQPLKIQDVQTIFDNEFGLKNDDVVFIHSSTNGLKLDFSSLELFQFIDDFFGDDGTYLFPAYPKGISYDFLKSGKTFDVRKTPTYTGLLNEYARRHKSAWRSLHPTKSVVAVGKEAKYLTEDHCKSPYPYDRNSPYFRISEFEGKIIGLGVKSTYMSCVHVIDDILRGEFPVNPYRKELFYAKCVDYDGNTQIVKTYAHDMNKMRLNIPAFIKKHISKDIARDFDYKGMSYFVANSKELFKTMTELARRGIAIYKY